VVEGVELPRVAAHVTPEPIVSAPTTTNNAILIRAMATSFRASMEAHEAGEELGDACEPFRFAEGQAVVARSASV
jgi:hypothetical protein